MNRRRLFVVLGFLILSAITAYLLRDVIHRRVVVPLVFLWWVLGFYYRIIPQVFIWIALIIIVCCTAVQGLLIRPRLRHESIRESKKIPGPVELLAGHFQKQGYGNYYKWLVANRLGRLASAMLDQREGISSPRRCTQLRTRDWNPPEEVMDYLETGLNGSFADYPRLKWPRARRTPLDLPSQQVIEYLETEMENRRDENRQGI